MALNRRRVSTNERARGVISLVLYLGYCSITWVLFCAKDIGGGRGAVHHSTSNFVTVPLDERGRDLPSSSARQETEGRWNILGTRKISR